MTYKIEKTFPPCYYKVSYRRWRWLGFWELVAFGLNEKDAERIIEDHKSGLLDRKFY